MSLYELGLNKIVIKEKNWAPVAFHPPRRQQQGKL